MGLEDKFYPDDGSYITRFDNLMIQSAGKIGELYQHLTGNSYKDLVKTSHKIAAIGSLITVSAGRVDGLGIGISSLIQINNTIYETPLEEEIKAEFYGVPIKIQKYFRLAFLFAIPCTFYFSNN